MAIPATPFDIGVFLVLVLPGVIYAAVRTRFAGYRGHDRDIGDRILQALTVSAVLDAVYLAVYLLIRGDRGGELFAQHGVRVLHHPRLMALSLLGFGILTPACLAYAIHSPLTWTSVVDWRPLAWLKWPKRGQSIYKSAPTAWDFSAPFRGGRWVRIRIGENAWVGGWMGEESYLSTYPEPRDMFIQDQHHVNDLGEIGDRVENSAGVWISLPEGAIVEWIDPESS